VAVDGDLPSIMADHDRLEQIFVNLLDNAVRHNPPGTSVRVALRRSGPEHVDVTVQDDGTGMVAFPPGPGQGRRSATAGAGLGLSIARGIVDAHGGTMELVAADRGTCFRIRLPVEGRRPADDGASDG
jgi:signal transduction histidine kinase